MALASTTSRPVKSTTKQNLKQFPRTLAGTVVAAPDAARTAVLQDYQKAVTFMQQGNFTAAYPALEKLLKEAPPEFIDRVRMYLAACVAQSNKSNSTFAGPEERYDYAISLLNDGQYDDARQHLNEILDGNQQADYAFYGLAVLASMTGDPATCLEKLTEAIRLNRGNRILARSDSDFQDMADDPRFTELLYPDA